MKKYLLLGLTLAITFACAKDNKQDEDLSNNNTSTIDGTDGGGNNTTSFSVVTCTAGQADDFACLGYDLHAFLPLSFFDSSFGNDVWGWTDPETQKEYVLLGLAEGTAFVDITDPLRPVLLGKLPTATVESVWRDIKVFQNHAFIVSEAPSHGVQVFDLTRLREVTSKQSFQPDARLTSIGSAHNIVINTQTGYAYVVGARDAEGVLMANGGALIVDINTPNQPRLVGQFSSSQYIHDAQVVLYHGPDTDYSGREILFASSSDGGSYYNLMIADVTDKTNPVLIYKVTYPFPSYTHQNWLTEDHRFALVGDETDELTHGYPSRTLVFDLADLDAPELYFEYLGTTSAIDHNGYVKGNTFYLANYTAGMRVYDLSAIEEKTITEIGFFDTYRENNNTAFAGVWSVYPYFESDIIVISDSDNGLFLVKASE